MKFPVKMITAKILVFINKYLKFQKSVFKFLNFFSSKLVPNLIFMGSSRMDFLFS